MLTQISAVHARRDDARLTRRRSTRWCGPFPSTRQARRSPASRWRRTSCAYRRISSPARGETNDAGSSAPTEFAASPTASSRRSWRFADRPRRRRACWRRGRHRPIVDRARHAPVGADARGGAGSGHHVGRPGHGVARRSFRRRQWPRVTRRTRAAAGVVISASHNPIEDNGIKFFGSDGFKLSDDVGGRDRGSRRVPTASAPDRNRTSASARVSQNLGRHYYEELYEGGADLGGLHVVVDGGYGAAYAIAPYALAQARRDRDGDQLRERRLANQRRVRRDGSARTCTRRCARESMPGERTRDRRRLRRRRGSGAVRRRNGSVRQRRSRAVRARALHARSAASCPTTPSSQR